MGFVLFLFLLPPPPTNKEICITEQEKKIKPNVVVHTCNPERMVAEAGGL